MRYISDLKDFLKNKFLSLERNLLSYEVIVNIKSRAGGIHPLFDLHFVKIVLSIFFSSLFLLLLNLIFWQPSSSFPVFSISTIEPGSHLREIADQLEKDKVVVSSFWLKFFVIIGGGEKKVIAGDYYFSEPVSVFKVSNIILNGEFGLTPTKVSMPEGLNSKEMAKVLSTYLPKFDAEDFIEEAKKNEGYLFPDTYFLMKNAKPKDIIAMMRENFLKKTESLKEDLEKFGKPEREVIIMASILEDEVKTLEDKRIVSGILWKRLKMNMLLQVDSTLRYVSGKTSSELTKDELVDKDNPYNTYANKGLPPTPISNPGLDSIRAAMAPTNTKYLYFLSGKDGTMHYAATFEEHKRNRELYLN